MAPLMKSPVRQSRCKSLTERLGCRLSGQVYRQGAVDRRHIRMLGNDQRVVGVVNRSEFDRGVVVDICIGLFLPHAKGSHCFSTVDRLLRIANDLFLHEIHDPFVRSSEWTPRSFLCSRLERIALGILP